MHGETHLIIKTDSGENEFQVRFLKDEGVGLITTRSDKNYLILDSLDFWYDLIQNQYPKKKKCSCKNECFKIQFCYIPRQNSNDFREITVFTTNEKGIYLHQDIWRRNEIIQLSSPIVMVGYGLLYLIHFCNQYLEKGEVKDKSKSFEEISLNLIDWLKMKFITRRGINCFDGEAAYNKYISGGHGHLKLKTV